MFIRIRKLGKYLYQASETTPIDRAGLENGTRAPIFTLTNINGQTISLADMRGHKTLLVFSSPSCKACEMIYPYLKTISFTRTDLSVVMISKASLEQNRLLAEKEGFDFPMLNGESTIFDNYRVMVVPFFYFLDREGVIIKRGQATIEKFEEIIEPFKK